MPQDGVFICVVLKESGVEAESIMFNDRLGKENWPFLGLCGCALRCWNPRQLGSYFQQ